MLYVRSEPVGAVMLMVPVATVHVGCVRVIVGAAGVGGCAFIVTGVGWDTQSPAAVLLAVIMCEPGATPLKVAEVW